MSNLDAKMRVCDTISQAYGIHSACDINDFCCYEENYFHFDNIGASLLYMGATAIIGFCLLFSVEYRIFDRLLYSCKKNSSTIPTTEDTDDSDVLEEKRRVRTGEIQPSNYEVVLKDLTKRTGEIQPSNYEVVLKDLTKRYRNFFVEKQSAIALIGDPAIVFLDEPTAGMDPSTRRNLWNTLCRIRDSGKCLVLTSHSMEECEALCTRLAIMVNGSFKCLGSTQHLKSKFSEGYMLTVKVKKTGLSYVFNDEDIAPIERYIKTHFPSAILKEKHQELLTYFIPDSSLPWSKMFGIMEDGKKEIDNIEDYSLGQSTLEQLVRTHDMCVRVNGLTIADELESSTSQIKTGSRLTVREFDKSDQNRLKTNCS
ncbi:hypothetical protein QE152_g15941 [Popillia japonica]|uniref:ABCA1-4-like C-terminal R2 regulatory domain-containing protein n=1 Tax=Popillia japonica TaxID=7064 RepID=A0AAW1L5L8_POPJA